MNVICADYWTKQGNYQALLWETPKLCMVEDCPFGNGMCWQIDELLTLYAFDPINTEGSHEPLQNERYTSVPLIPTYLDFITDHIFTHGGPNHRDGWTTLHLHKHATLWRYPVKHHHVQPIQRWTTKRMIEAVIQMHTYACIFTLMHAYGWNAWSGSSVGIHMHTSACIWIHMDTHACICMQSQSRVG